MADVSRFDIMWTVNVHLFFLLCEHDIFNTCPVMIQCTEPLKGKEGVFSLVFGLEKEVNFSQ